MDNLVGAQKIAPTVAVFVHTMDKRLRDLTDSPPFADFVGEELVPWVRKNYRISGGAGHVVIAGVSFGGLSASYCAFKHPEAIGNVLSLSGSYWLTKDNWRNQPPFPLRLADEPGDLVNEFRVSKRLPIRFFIRIGRFEGGRMLGANRVLREVLLNKGYPVTYKEDDGGHDYLSWRGSFADGLIALIGKKADRR